MIGSVDKFLALEYNPRTYNCLHFVRDVMFDMSGVDIKERLSSLFAKPGEFIPVRSEMETFKRLNKPKSPCLVVMSRPRSAETHVGVYVRGRILHLHGRGVEFQPIHIVALMYSTIRYYEC